MDGGNVLISTWPNDCPCLIAWPTVISRLYAILLDKCARPKVREALFMAGSSNPAFGRLGARPVEEVTCFHATLRLLAPPPIGSFAFVIAFFNPIRSLWLIWCSTHRVFS